MTRGQVFFPAVLCVAAVFPMAAAVEAPAPILFPAIPEDPAQRVALAKLRAADPRLVRLQAVVFDPLSHREPDFEELLPSGPMLRETDAGQPMMIQFEEPVTAATRTELSDLGFDVLGYLPHRTLVVRSQPGVPGDRLHSVSGRRWTGEYQPGYKLAPGLFHLLQAQLPFGKGVTLDVILFRDQDIAPVVYSIEERFEDVRVAYVKQRPPSRVTLEVPASALGLLVGALIRDVAVQFVEQRFPFEAHNDNAVWIGQSYDSDNGPVEAQATEPMPFTQSATIWSRGLTGARQIVAVADTGLEVGMCFFDDPEHPVTPQTVPTPGLLEVNHEHRKILAYNAPNPGALSTDDSFRHGTHVTGSVAGDNLANAASGLDTGHDLGDGMAPLAKIIFEDVSGSVSSSCNTSIAVDSVEELLEQEYAAGARISTNSWGSSAGGYDNSAMETEAAVWTHEDLVVFVAAGNHGGSGLFGMAACKNCIAVGATEDYDAEHDDVFGILDPENMAAFSSRGPTVDGRTKPDIVAPGYRVRSARLPVEYFFDEADPTCDPDNTQVCFPGFGGCYVTDDTETCTVFKLSGTSMASPVAAGLGALARQYFTDGFHPSGQANPADVRVPSAALLKAVMINGARNMTGHLYERGGTPMDFGPLEDAPSNIQGWGRVTLDDALYFSGDARRLYLFDIPNAQGIATGESVQVPLVVTGQEETLKLTLVWADPPGLPTASGVLINDLDLRLTTPEGTVYRGNQWTTDDVNLAGDVQSEPDAGNKDAVNNVEGILLQSPTSGLYTVHVTGFDVPGDNGVSGQGAALVVTGSIQACTSELPPQNLDVEAVSDLHLSLTWDPVPGALGYTVQRNASGCSNPMATDHSVSVPADRTNFSDTEVQPETSYHYTVRAVLSAEGCETVDSDCDTATTSVLGPPPVSDGIAGLPFLASRADAAGAAIDLTWDAGCPATGYHLLYGSLADVAAPELAADGGECNLDLSGSYNWSEVPVGDVWFLIVSNDGITTEGSWGQQTDGVERGGTTPSGQCGITQHKNNGSCL